ncbi:hypothetical protein SAMN05421833_11938 [Microbispora rosea]|uniref:Uncharacterized protein n=1 Tax=Microbispora rosea TaxID=58117 RepID=A0A1N7ER47_9ACTN|nr:hypothetical protein [Microbispora rosea]GIH50551.1 hypothetical protein Mro03_57300 [Microbispora rosea subsp. rosea]SIR90530.1 hypothetical protein SAMN05421833_11938 [Microbispora rosea]
MGRKVDLLPFIETFGAKVLPAGGTAHRDLQPQEAARFTDRPTLDSVREALALSPVRFPRRLRTSKLAAHLGHDIVGSADHRPFWHASGATING